MVVGREREPVPLHLRNAPTALMKEHGYGKGYRYAHDDPAARDEMTCLPEGLKSRNYFEKTDGSQSASARGTGVPEDADPG